MAHKARSNRKKNIRLKQERLEKLRIRQESIKKWEEDERKAGRDPNPPKYPVPPLYRYKDGEPQPEQPECYKPKYNPYQRYGRV